MEFEYQGKLLRLQGIQPSFKVVQAKTLEKLTRQDFQFFMVRVKGGEDAENPNNGSQAAEEPAEIKAVLTEYSKIFGEPTQLPPF